MKGRKTNLKVTSAGLAELGVTDRAALERAGLVRVRREPGKNTVVDILVGETRPERRRGVAGV